MASGLARCLAGAWWPAASMSPGTTGWSASLVLACSRIWTQLSYVSWTKLTLINFKTELCFPVAPGSCDLPSSPCPHGLLPRVNSGRPSPSVHRGFEVETQTPHSRHRPLASPRGRGWAMRSRSFLAKIFFSWGPGQG